MNDSCKYATNKMAYCTVSNRILFSKIKYISWFHVFQKYLKNTRKKNSKTKSHQQDKGPNVRF